MEGKTEEDRRDLYNYALNIYRQRKLFAVLVLEVLGLERDKLMVKGVLSLHSYR